MSQEITNQVHQKLQGFKFAEYPVELADAIDVSTKGAEVEVVINVGFPCKTVQPELIKEVEAALGSISDSVKVRIEQNIPVAPSLNSQNAVAGVKNIIAVASGKGGVGKSTTSVNLALALAYEGASVGVLDADIYGPSQTHMLGLEGQRPIVQNGNSIIPLQGHGLQCISMGNLVNENTPMVWRGPMVSGALQQLLNNTAWKDVDYLIIDMPPGTGDIQLTLSQSVPVTSSVIVTTPQDIALLDAKKGIEMFSKVNIPVVGVVENMATHVCSNCGHKEAIFGQDGGQKLAAEFGVEILGQLPLQLDIREQTDSGKPSVVNDPESPVSQEYRSIARKVAAHMWKQAQSSGSGPEISITDD